MKLLVVIAGSYPFDFATYVYQARSFYEYNLPLLFYWNKGMPLLLIFYSQYSIYTSVISMFNSGIENTLLLHICFKMPFYIAEILSALITFKILCKLNISRKLSFYAALVLFINPFSVISIDFAGSYAILASLSVLITLYLVLCRRFALSLIMLAVGTTIYYYPAIFLPFLILKISLELNISKKKLVYYVSIFLITILILYLPFIFSGSLLTDLINSLLHHSAPDSVTSATAIELPNYSLFKLPYYLIFQKFPTNLTTPLLFNTSTALTLIGALSMFVVFLKRIRRINNGDNYTAISFTTDITVSLSIFLVLIGKFQEHYLTWLIPLLIILSTLKKNTYLLTVVFGISFIALLNTLGSGNLAIFLLDIVKFGSISVYFAQTPYTQALGGFVVLVLIILSTAIIKSSNKEKETHKLNLAFIWLSFIFLVFISSISVIAILNSSTSKMDPSLGSDRNVYNFTYTSSINDISKTRLNKFDDIVFEDQSFEESSTGLLQYNKTLSSRSSWYLYSYKNQNNISAYIDNAGYKSNHSIKVVPSASNSALQINLDNAGSPNYLPVNASNIYVISTYIKESNMPSGSFRASIRYADAFKNTISGSDIILKKVDNSNNDGWYRYEAKVTPTKDASYLDLLLTVDIKNNQKVNSQSSVSFDNVTVEKYSQIDIFKYTNLKPNDNANSINKYIINNKTISNFQFDINVPRSSQVQQVKNAVLNECKPSNIKINDLSFIYTFEGNCIHNSNILTYELINFKDSPVVNTFLVHKSVIKHEVQYNKLSFVLIPIITYLIVIFIAIRVHRIKV